MIRLSIVLLARSQQERFLPQLLLWVVGLIHASGFYREEACLSRDG